MKKFLKAGALLCASAFALALIAGCDNTTKNEGTMSASGPSVSYVATETAVYNTTTEVVQNVADAVVEIATESVTTQFGMQYIVSGAGSGVIMGKAENDYYIVTNDHVIDGANEITVRTRAGEEFAASLIASDDSADIAVLTVRSETELKLAVWGNSDDVLIGETVIAIGNPLGNLGGTVTQGILSAAGRTITVGDFDMTLLQTDAAINPGNSGGGLFDMRGQLIGIVNAKTSEEGIEGLCFAIPANSARTAYTSLLEHGYLDGRATLHLTLAEGTLSGNMGLQSQTVVYVSALEEGADADFQQYDKITKIGDREISSILDYNRALAGLAPGQEVQIEVCRGRVTQSLFGGSLSFDSTPTTFTAVAAQYGA